MPTLIRIHTCERQTINCSTTPQCHKRLKLWYSMKNHAFLADLLKDDLRLTTLYVVAVSQCSRLNVRHGCISPQNPFHEKKNQVDGIFIPNQSVAEGVVRTLRSLHIYVLTQPKVSALFSYSCKLWIFSEV